MTSAIEISLMGREFRVACEPGEREALEAAVGYLDGRMREISGTTRASGERLLVMAALNITHDLLQLQQASGPGAEDARRRVAAIRERVDEALALQEQLF
jgi:cell division protein ZapA